MKRTFIVLSALVPACALLWGYLAVAQDVTSPGPIGPQLYDPSADSDQPEQSETARLRGREHELGVECQRLVREYSRTEDQSNRRQLEADLRKKVDEHFTTKQLRRAKELADLEAQLKRLRSRHQRRDNERARIVQDRVQQLLREADGLGWGSGSGNPDGWSRPGYEYLAFPPVVPDTIEYPPFPPVLPDAIIEEVREVTEQAARQAEEKAIRVERVREPRLP